MGVAVLARIKNSYHLMLVLNLFLSTVSPVGEVVMQDYWMRFLKLKEGVCVLGYNPATISF